MVLNYISAAFFFVFGVANLSYFLVHPNGKKYVRLFSSGIMFVFSVGYYMTYIPPDRYPICAWTIILGFISVWDMIVDWKSKKKING